MKDGKPRQDEIAQPASTIISGNLCIDCESLRIHVVFTDYSLENGSSQLPSLDLPKNGGQAQGAITPRLCG